MYVEDRIAQLENVSVDQGKQIEIIAEGVAKLKTEVHKGFAESKMRSDLMQHDISQLKKDMSGAQKDIKSLKTDVSILKDDVKTLKTDVAVIQKDLKDIRSEMDERFNLMDKRFDKMESNFNGKFDLLVELIKAK